MSVADLDDDTIMCAREAFTLYGRGSGGLSGDNLYTALRCCSVNPTYDSVKAITDGADEVDLEMFMQIVATTKIQGSGKDVVLKAFQAMDRTNKGTVSATELNALLSNSGEKLSSPEIKAAIGKYGSDIPYEKLVNDIFAAVPVVAKASGGGRSAAPKSTPKAAPAKKAAPAPAKAPAKAPPADDFGGGFGGDDDDDNDEFGF